MVNTLSVLLVDDDEDDYILTNACLKEIPGKKFDVTWASNFNDAKTLLFEKHYDICFFDYLLGAGTGLDLLRIAQEFQVQTPIILLTGRGDIFIDTEAMRLGVTDYIVKRDLQPENLERSIRYAIERTASLNAIKESEQKYRSLFEGSADVICLLDEDGRFIDVNTSAVRLLGLPKEAFLSKKITDFFENEAVKSAFQKILMAREDVRDFETEIFDSNQERRDYLITCTCLPSPGKPGKIIYQGILHDITLRKRAEQEQLIAEKLAATGRFVRMLAHEIRNPLTNIDLAISQLSPDSVDLDLNDIIARNSKRIGQLLKDLLQSSNPGHLNFKPCAPDVLLEEALALAADRISLKNIRVIKSYAPHLDPIRADAEKLKIALLNIIINAVEIMEADTGLLTVGIQNTSKGCSIVIGDNGPGIAREHINNIFDPYFSRKPNGLGLGLSSTLNIVQSHNGRIQVESELGKGTEFTVLLMPL